MAGKGIGILYPGQMGVSIAASARNSGNEVCWVSEGRSQATRERAASISLRDAGTLADLCARCELILSVCPPHIAEDVAQQVIDQGFSGIYADCNAISPDRVKRIGAAMADAGVRCVDGGIIGGPAWKPGSTWLYLSGADAEEVAGCFAAGPLETSVIGTEVGKASALKMCFAAYTKGSTALLCGILAAAERLGVWPELEAQWSRRGSDFAERTISRVRGVTAKAWRFVGEMEEISATFEGTGMPGGFHAAAADVYRRIAHFKGAAETPSLEEVVGALLGDA